MCTRQTRRLARRWLPAAGRAPPARRVDGVESTSTRVGSESRAGCSALGTRHSPGDNGRSGNVLSSQVAAQRESASSHRHSALGRHLERSGAHLTRTRRATADCPYYSLHNPVIAPPPLPSHPIPSLIPIPNPSHTLSTPIPCHLLGRLRAHHLELLRRSKGIAKQKPDGDLTTREELS